MHEVYNYGVEVLPNSSPLGKPSAFSSILRHPCGFALFVTIFDSCGCHFFVLVCISQTLDIRRTFSISLHISNLRHSTHFLDLLLQLQHVIFLVVLLQLQHFIFSISCCNCNISFSLSLTAAAALHFLDLLLQLQHFILYLLLGSGTPLY
jgi:hypothetical protein